MAHAFLERLWTKAELASFQKLAFPILLDRREQVFSNGNAPGDRPTAVVLRLITYSGKACLSTSMNAARAVTFGLWLAPSS